MSGVADWATLRSLQPSRRPVLPRIAEVLETAPSARSGLPQGFTHHELACLVYETATPASAQLSAVRRAVAKLVAAGRAERDLERGFPGEHDSGKHERTSRYGRTFYAFNPVGVVVSRTPTEADRVARAAVVERAGYGEWAERIRAGEPL